MVNQFEAANFATKTASITKDAHCFGVNYSLSTILERLEQII